jgi:hypothetical protein
MVFDELNSKNHMAKIQGNPEADPTSSQSHSAKSRLYRKIEREDLS